MIKQLLNGKWKMKSVDEAEWVESEVPGSVLSALTYCCQCWCGKFISV